MKATGFTLKEGGNIYTGKDIPFEWKDGYCEIDGIRPAAVFFDSGLIYDNVIAKGMGVGVCAIDFAR